MQQFPITRQHFIREASSVKAHIGDKDIHLMSKEYSTGSLGWYGSEKHPMMLDDGTEVWVQTTVQIIAVNSKLAEDEPKQRSLNV